MPIEDLFKEAVQLGGEALPLVQPEARQPAIVSGVGELLSGSGSPAQMRLHDPEIAMVIPENLVEPAAPDTGPFIVRVVESGGFAGDVTNPATFLYTVYTLNGEILDSTNANPIQPEEARPSAGRLVAPLASPTDEGNPYGLAFWDENHTLHLLWVGEPEAVRACT